MRGQKFPNILRKIFSPSSSLEKTIIDLKGSLPVITIARIVNCYQKKWQGMNFLNNHWSTAIYFLYLATVLTECLRRTFLKASKTQLRLSVVATCITCRRLSSCSYQYSTDQCQQSPSSATCWLSWLSADTKVCKLSPTSSSLTSGQLINSLRTCSWREIIVRLDCNKFKWYSFKWLQCRSRFA